MRPIDSEANSFGLTPSFSPSIIDGDFITDGESSEDSQSPGLSTYRRNIPPRQSSQPNGNRPLSESPYGSDRTEDDEKYFKAYWARIHERRRTDPHSLPLVPYTDELYGVMDERDEYHAPPRNFRAYQKATPRRPLIDYIHNEWRNSSSSSGSSPNEKSSPSWAQIISAPLLRRSVLMIILFSFLVWANWKYWVDSQWKDPIVLNNALQGVFKPGQSMFGTNTRPAFRDMIHMRTMNQDLIPQKGDKTRLIVVGDVHGCVDELVALLTKISYNAGHDHLVFVGDMISKGSSSASVIKLAMSMKASCVRGNHEDRVLLTYRDMNSHSLSLASLDKKRSNHPDLSSGTSEEPASLERFLDGELFSHGNSVDRELTSLFDQKQIDYMASCPVILRLGRVRRMGEVQVVHAGLVPGVKLERQDPASVMNMRTIDFETHVPSRSADGIPWNQLWNKHQASLPEKNRSTVIYGHDSHRGLQLTRYTKGIDTGCVKGGKLTALIITGHDTDAKPHTVSVNCKDYRTLEVQREEKLGTLGQS